MSVASVRQEVQKALSNDTDRMNPTIDGDEAEAIIAAAEHDGKVTNSEAKAIADAYHSALGPASNFPNPSGCLYTGPIMADAAKSAFDGFFAAHGVPAGANAVTMKEQLSEAARAGRGEALRTPPSTRGLFEVNLGDLRRVDGPMTTAYLDPAKGSFYLKVTPGFFRPPTATTSPSWYGPIALNHANQPKPLTDATKAAMLAQAESATFNSQIPFGVRFATVMLHDGRPTDGVAYEALVATGALAPGAKQITDLNDAKSYFLTRIHPRSGERRFAGPFKMPAADICIIPPYISERLAASKAIEASFAEQFPPRYTSMLEIDTATFRLQKAASGEWVFQFTAKEYNGSFTGQRLLKGERHYSGTLDAKSGRATFTEAAAQ